MSTDGFCKNPSLLWRSSFNRLEWQKGILIGHAGAAGAAPQHEVHIQKGAIIVDRQPVAQILGLSCQGHGRDSLSGLKADRQKGVAIE